MRKMTPISFAGGEFKLLFSHFDADGDGRISSSELRQLLLTIGEEVSSADAEDALRSADADGDGLLDLTEFARLAGDMDCEEAVREAFSVYEMEGEGCITARSLKRALSRLGESRGIDDCCAMIRRFDLDGDGALSLYEFREMMKL
ncbi:putative calcium-binding protein CML31 [Apostasia shenzhenica]|uniref:Putative calcium-binding protein CML31 n=1 Tax=Apostasia shenzhenica TaxID=1088818 RepID=A0A2I0BGH2_9ASPA|nr:putative calcium-binding protein CML31 [Apostasia shenzhenica]